MSYIDRMLARVSGVEPKAAPATASPPPSVAAPVPMLTAPSPVRIPRRPQSASASDFLWSLDTPLLRLSRRDFFTVRDACAGVHGFGANGSGKTSGSGRTFAKAYLRAGFGGVVLCAKPDEAAQWRRYGEETGRLDQMIFVTPDGPWRFNFIQYELGRREGDPARRVENLLKVLSSLLEQSGRQVAAGEAQFWHNAAEMLLRYALMALVAARPMFTLADVQAFIDTGPRSEAEAQGSQFDESPCGRDLAAARKAYVAANRIADFAAVENYWRVQFPRLPERTRGSVVMTLHTMLGDLLTGTVRELFSTGTNFFPEDTHEGAVVVLDLPAYESNAFLLAQTLFKTVWQQAAIRRGERLGKRARPLFLFADEAQFFVTARDTDFFSIARSARVAPVYMTQNLAAYQQRLGGGNAEHTAQALLGYFQTRVFHALSDPPTIQYAQQLFGKTVRRRTGSSQSTSDSLTTSRGEDRGRNGGSSSGESWSINRGWSWSRSSSRSYQLGTSTSWSENEQLEDALFAQDFSMLANGGPDNGYRVQAFVFATGRTWAANGTNCLPTVFDQRV